jgi:hypothetical protein
VGVAIFTFVKINTHPSRLRLMRRRGPNVLVGCPAKLGHPPGF